MERATGVGFGVAPAVVEPPPPAAGTPPFAARSSSASRARAAARARVVAASFSSAAASRLRSCPAVSWSLAIWVPVSPRAARSSSVRLVRSANGEAYLRSAVRLAPGAVVVLSHLCYASGNSEPGDPEPTTDVAVQRADNFAAGWLAIGADAVIADARLGPAFYVRHLLEGRLSATRIWFGAPSSRGHVLAVASRRTPGAVVLLDPDDPTAGGWFRSLTTRSPGQLAGIRWLGDPVTAPTAVGPAGDPLADSLLSDRLRIDPPGIVGGQATAGVPLTVQLPIAWRLPLDLLAAVRWVPLELDPEPPVRDGEPPVSGADPAEAVAGPEKSEPRATGVDRPSRVPDVVLVAPEEPGQVVEPVQPVARPDGLWIDALAPEVPGRYRLVVSLHRRDGTALPAEVQARIPSTIVRVTGRLSVTFALPAAMTAYAGQVVAVPVAIRNSGSVEWGGEQPGPATEPTPRTAPKALRLVATWVGLEAPWSRKVDPGRLLEPLRPSEETTLVLLVRVPDVPGPYLLIVDVDSPAHGSLIAAGSEPGLARIVVLDRSATDEPLAPGGGQPAAASG